MARDPAGYRCAVVRHLAGAAHLGDKDCAAAATAQVTVELSASTILTLAGMAISVIAAAAIAKQRLASVIEQLGDIEMRLRKIDQRVDRHETQVEMQAQRTSVLSGMMSPDIQERRHREIATLTADVSGIRTQVDKLLSMHNGKHPSISAGK